MHSEPVVTTIYRKGESTITWAKMQHVALISRASDARISICDRDTIDDVGTKQEKDDDGG